MNARFLTESEVAERTQISLATLRRWRLENRGPKYRKFGSLVRYAEDELANWEQNQPGGGDVADSAKPEFGREGGLRVRAKSAREQVGRTASSPKATHKTERSPASDAAA
jgi:predicted DNA-binding transcriptional regulator AlpA